MGFQFFLIVTVTVFSILSTYTEGREKLGNDDILMPDGTFNMAAYGKSLIDCADSSNSLSLAKITIKMTADCGFLNAGSDPYKLACGVACALTQLDLITKGKKFQTDESKIRRALADYEVAKDEKTVKRIAKEYATCAHLAPPYKEKNCYSAVAFAVCLYFGVRKVCVGTP